MARCGWVRPRVDQRLTDHVSLGVLTRVFPADLVDGVVERCGRVERRSRLMPARLTVYFTLALALFSAESYEDVIRQLVAGLEWESGWRRRWRPPTKAALFKARERLGAGVVEGLFRAVAAPVGRGVLVGGLRVVAVDATVLDVPDTVANVEGLGRPAAKQGAVAAYPQVRVLALADCGALAVFAASLSGLSTGEQSLLPDLLGALDSSMLLVADRGLFSYDLWRRAAATGARLCWRMRVNSVLPNLGELPDGSYLSRVYPSPKARRHDLDGLDVRVVEYRVGASAEPYRLITTILDPDTACAADLAGAYRMRWRIESTFDELKTHQGGPSLVLRSKSPELVRQEVWAYLCVHHAIRWLMADTARTSGLDPTEMSFTVALRSARRTTTAWPGFSPQSTS